MALIDLVLIIFAIIMITQVMIPFIFPKAYGFFWLFRRRGNLSERVNTYISDKQHLEEYKEEVKTEAKSNLDEATQVNQKINELN